MTELNLLEGARAVAGADAVRIAEPGVHLVDGVMPRLVVEPNTPEQVAATLGWASTAGLSVVLRGAGSKDRRGRTPVSVDVLLGFGRLNRILAHEAGDLTTTVEAGARLADVNAHLARKGQYLALDPPHADRATIGGIIATNDSGPLRHRFGTPRDLIIGVRLACTDGTLASAGGRVVKNVAGYDLGRMMAGAGGSLAAMVSATFKLAPLPEASKTVVARVDTAARALSAITCFTERQREPVQVEVRVGRDAAGVPLTLGLLVRHATVQSAVDHAVDETLADLVALGVQGEVLEPADEALAWREHARQPWANPASSAVVRVSWLPADLPRLVEGIERAAQLTPFYFQGRAAIGSGLIRIDGDPAGHARIIGRLREDPLLAHVVILDGPPDLRSLVDAWGPPGAEARLWPALVRACDPHGVLNAGRGPM